MVALTDDQVLERLTLWQQYSRIQVENRRLFSTDESADCIHLKFPETPLRSTYFSRSAAMLGTGFDESMFYGALLWITLHDIGSPQLEKSGWKMIEMMRRSYGENRPLEAASGHSFRNGDVVELTAFVLLCFVFSWDAWIVPSTGNFFIYISHDEYWVIVTRDQETYTKLWNEVNDLDPEQGSVVSLRKFCPNSARLTFE